MNSKADANQIDTLLEGGFQGPVALQQEGQEVAVVVSPENYEMLRRLKVEQFLAFCDQVGSQAQARGLTEEILTEILAGDGED